MLLRQGCFVCLGQRQYWQQCDDIDVSGIIGWVASDSIGRNIAVINRDVIICYSDSGGSDRDGIARVVVATVVPATAVLGASGNIDNDNGGSARASSGTGRKTTMPSHTLLSVSYESVQNLALALS